VRESPLQDVKLTFVDSIESLWRMKAWAGERREEPLCFDTETTGTNPSKDHVRLIQLGDCRQGWAVPFPLWGGGAMELLSSYQGRLSAHNSSFDCRFLMKHAGWQPPWGRVDDTMIMAHLCDPSRPKGLKALADRLLDPRASAGEKALRDGMKKQGWSWATVPVDFQPYWIYGALDPVLTACIWARLHPQVAASYSEAYSFELEVSRICGNMMLKGMRVDVPYLTRKIRELKDFSQQARDWMLEAWGITSPMSGPQITRVIEKSGQQLMFFTDSGLPAADKDALAWYKVNARTPEIAQLIDYVLTVRHAEKMTGTYLESLLALRDDDCLVHCSIWPLGAKTGRMSITDPALQTLPRDDLVVRNAFIPHKGNVLISCDYDQVEMRLAAHFSQDQGLIQAFLDADAPGGTDFFSAVASQIFQEKISKGDKRRQMTKNMGYARLYGAGLDKMALTAGVTSEVMKPVKDAFDARYPGLNAMARAIEQESRQRVRDGLAAGVLTPLGRFIPAQQDHEYALVNHKIQSHAAEVLKRAIIDADSSGLGEYMLLPVHDELLFEVPADMAEEACRSIQKVMENRADYAVPITCEPKIMRSRWTGKS
jgi:DNA polymerase I